jgi:hypothetical protein
MKKLFLPLMGLALLGAGCFGKANGSNGPIVSNPTPAPGYENSGVEEMVVIDDYINGDTVAVYEEGTLQSLQSAQGNIYVISPLPNAIVGNSLVITGNARVFENVISYRI